MSMTKDYIRIGVFSLLGDDKLNLDFIDSECSLDTYSSKKLLGASVIMDIMLYALNKNPVINLISYSTDCRDTMTSLVSSTSNILDVLEGIGRTNILRIVLDVPNEIRDFDVDVLEFFIRHCIFRTSKKMFKLRRLSSRRFDIIVSLDKITDRAQLSSIVFMIRLMEYIQINRDLMNNSSVASLIWKNILNITSTTNYSSGTGFYITDLIKFCVYIMNGKMGKDNLSSIMAYSGPSQFVDVFLKPNRFSQLLRLLHCSDKSIIREYIRLHDIVERKKAIARTNPNANQDDLFNSGNAVDDSIFKDMDYFLKD